MKNYKGNYILTGLIKWQVCDVTMVSIRITDTLKDRIKKVLRYY